MTGVQTCALPISKLGGQIPFIGVFFTGPPMGIGLLTAYGLGATTWEVVRHVVLPYTKVGVVGGIMLGLGRALGETMAITFVIGNAYNVSWSLFSPGNSIASMLANEFAEAHGELHTSALIYIGLLLFVITLIVLIAAKLLLLRLTRNEGNRT